MRKELNVKLGCIQFVISMAQLWDKNLLKPLKVVHQNSIQGFLREFDHRSIAKYGGLLKRV